MRFHRSPRKRSRFDQCRRKLGILRKKRGRETEGDSLLLSVIESLRHQNWEAAVEDLKKYLLLVQALTSEERAIVDGVCCELQRFNDKAVAGRLLRKVAIWSGAVVAEEIIRYAVNLLISHIVKNRNLNRVANAPFA